MARQQTDSYAFLNCKTSQIQLSCYFMLFAKQPVVVLHYQHAYVIQVELPTT